MGYDKPKLSMSYIQNPELEMQRIIKKDLVLSQLCGQETFIGTCPLLGTGSSEMKLLHSLAGGRDHTSALIELTERWAVGKKLAAGPLGFSKRMPARDLAGEASGRAPQGRRQNSHLRDRW